MNEEQEIRMFNNGLMLGIGIGAISGAISAFLYHKNKPLNADTVLSAIKQSFLQEGPIEGSWIEFDKKPRQKFAIKGKTYTGGISRIEDGTMVQYEFVADALTGTVIDIVRI